ncbi:hypothetical protein [Burkholderia savannae]|uniref:hypothetical protein n=1 Tax=Burkholderia savannae TaxID=1637837 RepID=UPI000AE05473|nr:hypothetical protein [Burkholderia savannae]
MNERHEKRGTCAPFIVDADAMAALRAKAAPPTLETFGMEQRVVHSDERRSEKRKSGKAEKRKSGKAEKRKTGPEDERFAHTAGNAGAHRGGWADRPACTFAP